MYVIVWQFQVTPGRERAFEEAYGPDGDWARFFGRSAGFQGTELLRATLEPEGETEGGDVSQAADDAAEADQDGRDYLTIDRWASADAYAAFNERFTSEYEQMDARFLELCVVQVCLGHFEVVDSCRARDSVE
jgi:heme-degrading monooxygenase HmoA